MNENSKIMETSTMLTEEEMMELNGVSNTGAKIGKGLFIAGLGACVVALAVKAVKKVKSIRRAKKDTQEDIVDTEYVEVVSDGE